MRYAIVLPLTLLGLAGCVAPAPTTTTYVTPATSTTTYTPETRTTVVNSPPGYQPAYQQTYQPTYQPAYQTRPTNTTVIRTP